jgi:hypothetical protein
MQATAKKKKAEGVAGAWLVSRQASKVEGEHSVASTALGPKKKLPSMGGSEGQKR